jgi:membrane protease YdiL (CAAX protease family)
MTESLNEGAASLPTQPTETSRNVDTQVEATEGHDSHSTGLLRLLGYGITAVTLAFLFSNALVWVLSKPISSLNLPVGSHHVFSMVYSVAIILATFGIAKAVSARVGMRLWSVALGVFNPAHAYRYLWSGVIGAVVLMAISVGSAVLLGGRSAADAVAPYQVMNLPTLAAYFGFTVALAPIAEEMLFRGVLMSVVRNSVIPGAKVLMVGISAFGFMFYHVAGAFISAVNLAVASGSFEVLTTTVVALLPQIVMYLLSGIALCVLALKTQNIYASWLAHAIYNMALLYGVNSILIGWVTG